MINQFVLYSVAQAKLLFPLNASVRCILDNSDNDNNRGVRMYIAKVLRI